MYLPKARKGLGEKSHRKSPSIGLHHEDTGVNTNDRVSQTLPTSDRNVLLALLTAPPGPFPEPARGSYAAISRGTPVSKNQGLLQAIQQITSRKLPSATPPPQLEVICAEDVL